MTRPAGALDSRRHAFGAADLRLARRTCLALEARYVWADAELDRDFAGFEPISTCRVSG